MDEDAMDSYFIESSDNFTVEASIAPLPAKPNPTLTTTEKRSTEASTSPLPPEPTPTLTTTEKCVDVLCSCLYKCSMIGHGELSNHKCPYCQLNNHGICGVKNPKGGLHYDALW